MAETPTPATPRRRMATPTPSPNRRSRRRASPAAAAARQGRIATTTQTPTVATPRRPAAMRPGRRRQRRRRRWQRRCLERRGGQAGQRVVGQWLRLIPHIGDAAARGHLEERSGSSQSNGSDRQAGQSRAHTAATPPPTGGEGGDANTGNTQIGKRQAQLPSRSAADAQTPTVATPRRPAATRPEATAATPSRRWQRRCLERRAGQAGQRVDRTQELRLKPPSRDCGLRGATEGRPSSRRATSPTQTGRPGSERRQCRATGGKAGRQHRQHPGVQRQRLNQVRTAGEKETKSCGAATAGAVRRRKRQGWRHHGGEW